MGTEVSVHKPSEDIGPDNNNSVIADAQIRLMDQKVRQRVRQGVQYNMKIGVCGMRGSGWLLLLLLLEGVGCCCCCCCC